MRRGSSGLDCQCALFGCLSGGKLRHQPEVRLISSSYAADEAARNLTEARQRDRLAELLQSVELKTAIPPALLPDGIKLAEKDVPIRQGAIAAKATHLLTSNLKHFGPCFWQIVEGVRILPPAAYLKGKL